MSEIRRFNIGMLSAVFITAFVAAAFAAGHGGGGGFGGGGGHMGGFSGGGYSGGHMSGFSGGGYSGHMSGYSGANSSFNTAGFSHGPSGQPNFSNAGHNFDFNHSQGFNGQHSNWNSQFSHGNTAWNANHGVWNHGGDWWNHHEPDRYDFFGFGFFGWPWFAFDWGPGYWWPNYYGSYYCPYGDIYGDYGYAAAPYVTAYPPAGQVAEAARPKRNPQSAASDYYVEGVNAFRQGDYANATRLAAHAAVDDPRTQNVHVLAMLGLFAMGEYRGAAMEAHAVTALGKPPDWPKVYAFYGDINPYTEQLRKLEKWWRRQVGPRKPVPVGLPVLDARS